jgi:hypothetical protein
MILLILALIVTASTPLKAAATPSDAFGVGFGAEELEPQTPRALELASQAHIDHPVHWGGFAELGDRRQWQPWLGIRSARSVARSDAAIVYVVTGAQVAAHPVPFLVCWFLYQHPKRRLAVIEGVTERAERTCGVQTLPIL